MLDRAGKATRAAIYATKPKPNKTARACAARRAISLHKEEIAL